MPRAEAATAAPPNAQCAQRKARPTGVHQALRARFTPVKGGIEGHKGLASRRKRIGACETPYNPPFRPGVVVCRVLLFLVLLLAPALVAAADGPSGCKTPEHRLYTTCETTPNGSRGAHASTPAGFVFLGTGQAGAGSVAGAVASYSPARAAVALYGSTLLAFDVLVIGLAPRDANGDGVPDAYAADATVAHTGLPRDERQTVTLEARDVKQQDKVPERVRLVASGPVLVGEAGNAPEEVRLRALGVPVVLVP